METGQKICSKPRHLISDALSILDIFIIKWGIVTTAIHPRYFNMKAGLKTLSFTCSYQSQENPWESKSDQTFRLKGKYGSGGGT